jgi:uncharacterized SAM-binding protein YcdF (DUF218 family)
MATTTPPATPSPAVPVTQINVTTTSTTFFDALRSAHLPTNGPATIANAAETESPAPHKNSAHSAPAQIVLVKKTPPTTVTTTVTNALFAKSYQHQAKISPLPADPFFFMKSIHSVGPIESKGLPIHNSFSIFLKYSHE